MGVPWGLPDANVMCLVPGDSVPDSGTPLGKSEVSDPQIDFTTTLTGKVFWDFGDGSYVKNTSGTASRTYAANGTYTVYATNGVESETVNTTVAGA